MERAVKRSIEDRSKTVAEKLLYNLNPGRLTLTWDQFRDYVALAWRKGYQARRNEELAERRLGVQMYKGKLESRR